MPESQVFSLKSYSPGVWVRFAGLSGIGILMFFVPLKIGERSTIPLDHLVNFLNSGAASLITPYYALLIILLGTLRPFITKSWNDGPVKTVFSLLNILGLAMAILALTFKSPNFLFSPDMVPFLFNKLVIPVGLIVPAGALFLSFIVGYGLMEFIGVIMQPVMRTIWKTPGRSAVDAVASFVGSYSVGLLITDRVYKDGGYTAKEAAVIATGFSTVSATFMVIVARTLGLMELWNLYFWSTLLITFLVTAVTVRIFPLSRMPSHVAVSSQPDETRKKTNIFHRALTAGLQTSSDSSSLPRVMALSVMDGFKMAMSILPSILSVGLMGLLLAKYTPIFDYLAYILYPITALAGLSEPLLAAKASILQVAEMFLPALLVKDASFPVRYVVGVVSVSSILFFSASIPCILSTSIPIKIRDIMIIWFERTVLSLILASVVVRFL